LHVYIKVMARKYKECLDCRSTDKKESWSLCSNCRKLRRIDKLKLANANKHKCVNKEKHCKNCDIVFLTKGPGSLYCRICGPIMLKEKTDKSRIKSALKKGVKVGIGSGNYFGKFNTEHPSYKSGIRYYRELALQNKPGICERCSLAIDFTNSYKWCVHHKDHNRKNNTLENLELLCKRCHQLEHNCIDNLPNK
jgi:hypothetical protein